MSLKEPRSVFALGAISGLAAVGLIILVRWFGAAAQPGDSAPARSRISSGISELEQAAAYRGEPRTDVQKKADAQLIVDLLREHSLARAKERERYTKAAEQGEVTAQLHLGRMYWTGDGGRQDAAQAIEWFTKAAEQGDATAQCSLGRMYWNGDSVPRNAARVPKDAAQALKWFTKAAEQGDATAQLHLGRMNWTGDGVPKDAAQAIEWFTKAAEQGDATAQLRLGRMYWTGDGVPKDAAQAIEWFTKAAEQGDGEAQYLLHSYSQGAGFP